MEVKRIEELENPISPKTLTNESSLTFLFGITLFVSAALLFSVQPMVAKMLLPLLGGTPAVEHLHALFSGGPPCRLRLCLDCFQVAVPSTTSATTSVAGVGVCELTHRFVVIVG